MEVADVGVTTRARAALALAASSPANAEADTVAKRRKINNNELKSSSSSYVQLRSQRRRIMKEDRKISQTYVETEDSSSSPSSYQLPESCCSSNRSTELEEERRSNVDLKVESAEVETSTTNCNRERREMSPPNGLRLEIDDQESTKKMPPFEHNCLERSTVDKMPTELEIEKFFTAAEKDLEKKFEEKYNFDIVKDVPLEGRYKWIPLKQKQ